MDLHPDRSPTLSQGFPLQMIVAPSLHVLSVISVVVSTRRPGITESHRSAEAILATMMTMQMTRMARLPRQLPLLSHRKRFAPAHDVTREDTTRSATNPQSSTVTKRNTKGGKATWAGRQAGRRADRQTNRKLVNQAQPNYHSQTNLHSQYNEHHAQRDQPHEHEPSSMSDVRTGRGSGGCDARRKAGEAPGMGRCRRR